jgi:uncharacterized membrane protein
MSRRRELGLATFWIDIFDLRNSPSLPSILLLGCALLTFFICWQAAAEWLYIWLFGPAAPESLYAFFIEVFTTSQGWTLIILGHAIGFVFAVAVLSISVVSFPLLLDRDVGVAVAVHTSVRAVLASPLTMGLLCCRSSPMRVGISTARSCSDRLETRHERCRRICKCERK